MQSLTWTASNGQQIEITVSASGYDIRINGKQTGTCGQVLPVPAAIAAKAAAAGIVGLIGQVGVTAERKAALETMRAQAIAEGAALSDLYRLESALSAAEATLSCEGYGETGANGTAVEAARAALAAWQTAHSGEWAAVLARRQQETAEHKAELAQSFVARGLD